MNPRLISSSTDYFHMILIISWASSTAHTKSLPSICWYQGCCRSICTCLWNIVCIYLCAKWSVHHGVLVETLQHLYPNYPIPTKLKNNSNPAQEPCCIQPLWTPPPTATDQKYFFFSSCVLLSLGSCLEAHYLCPYLTLYSMAQCTSISLKMRMPVAGVRMKINPRKYPLNSQLRKLRVLTSFHIIWRDSSKHRWKLDEERISSPAWTFFVFFFYWSRLSYYESFWWQALG